MLYLKKYFIGYIQNAPCGGGIHLGVADSSLAALKVCGKPVNQQFYYLVGPRKLIKVTGRDGPGVYIRMCYSCLRKNGLIW